MSRLLTALRGLVRRLDTVAWLEPLRRRVHNRRHWRRYCRSQAAQRRFYEARR